ncbi:MAG: phage tail fiber protein [Magnetospirillum sp. WYHS-4]
MTEHIQIGDVSPRIQYVADGVQTLFTYPFPVFAVADIEVYVDTVKKVLNADYSVTGAGTSNGGTIGLSAAPVGGAVVTLRRKLAIQRSTDFQESGDFRAKTINDELDRQTAFAQQVADDLGRSIRLGDTDVAATLTLPAKAARSMKIMAFDVDGNVAVSSRSLAEIETDAANASLHAANAASSAAAAAVAEGSAASARDGAEQARDEAQAAVGGIKVSANDTMIGNLEAKLLASGLAGLTTQNDGGNETRTLDVPIASQAEAEAGTDNGVAMTPLRVAQAIAFQTGGTSENDRLFALSIAELKGDRYNMVDGIADPFADETDVATKTGATYDATEDYYHNTASGYGINLFTTGNGSASSPAGTPGNLIDGNEATWWTGTAAPQYWTYTFSGSGEVISKFSLSNSSSSGNYGPGALSLKASNTGAFAGEEVTFLDLSGLSNWAIPETREWTFANSTTYKYWRLTVTQILGGSSVTLGEAKAYAAASPSDMTLVSSAFTADAVPATARLAIQTKPIDGITINTDLVGKVGRDGGTTWTAATLMAVETLADGTTLYEDADIDISAQPSGSAMKYRIETANGKQIQVHGVVLQWKD